MTLTRRDTLGLVGGGLLAALSPPARAGGVVKIRMQGRADGSHVWFDKTGLMIEPG